MRTQLSTLALATALAFGAVGANAAEKSLEQSVKEARLEGQLHAAIMFNPHLNPFEIAVDVEGDTAILTGSVDEAIDKELAERVALNAQGIARVDNRILIDEGLQPTRRTGKDRGFGELVSDATTTATVKSRLLWNEQTSGLGINVDTVDGRVTLSGTVATAAEKDAAARLALDTDGVVGLDNRLAVEAGAAEGRVAERAGTAISDAWITTKVKSSLLYSKNVDGLDLTVETNEGVVLLSGSADTRAERDLAVEIAKDILGVKQVDASAVKIRA